MDNPPASRPFVILCLDGGGARGFLSSRILANIESHINTTTGSDVKLSSRFDLIVGTSTGGLIALALAAGASAADIHKCYGEQLARVFSRPRSRVRRWFAPKYENAELERVAVSLLQEKKLSDVLVDVCISTLR